MRPEYYRNRRADNPRPGPPIQYAAMTTFGPGVLRLTRHPGATSADTDTVDVALAASGDTRAFERVYRRHVARVHSLARRMLEEDLADEVTQDVFVRAWEKLHTFRGEAAFGTWLHRLAINVILARRGALGVQRRRFAGAPDSLERLATRAAEPGRRIDLEEAMAALPAGAREVFVLHDIEGYRHEEIAHMLGVAEGTSKSQLHRARMALRAHLNR